MAEVGEHRRRYGDKEVGLILKRAAELQRHEPESAVEGGGLSLTELEEVAAEVGIDPRHLRRAASEIDAGGAGLQTEGMARLLGGPLTISLKRSLPGEFPPGDFDKLAGDIQQAADGQGGASVLGNTLTWRSTSPNNERSLMVTVTSRDGRTRILIEERLSQLAAGLFGGIVGGGGLGVGLGVGMGVGLGVLGSAAFAITFPVAVIGGAYVLARTIYGSVLRRRQRVLRDLLDRLTERVTAATTGRPLVTDERPPALPGDSVP